MEGKNILICGTGSVASLKIPILVKQLLETNNNFKIQIITTEHAKHFFKESELPENVKLWSDEDEWSSWKNRGDPVLHIELGKWADLLVIAPLDANSLAKMATGICDNLLLCTTRAWNFDKPLLFCPAMNTRMWDHPITSQHISILKSWGHIEVPCVEKTLICGDTGLGAMAEVQTIVDYVVKNCD